MKKKDGTKSTKPVKDLNEEESIAHYNAIMIEDLRSTIRTELEGLHSKMDSFERRMGSFETRMDSLDAKMDKQCGLLHTAIRCNADGIRELSAKMDRIIDRVNDHEERISQIEKVS